MEVIDLTEAHQDLFFVCLEDWSDEMREAGDRKSRWFEQMSDRGLRVKLAIDERGEVGGMIQYCPVEHSFVAGADIHVVLCVWVHGYKAGRGDFTGRGMGRALLEAAEDDAMALGARGMAAWGLAIPIWMRASWFKRQGYRKVDRLGLQTLLFKPFTEAAVRPRLIRPGRGPDPTPGKVTVTCLNNGWCPGQNLVYERAKRAAAHFGKEVVFRLIDTTDRETFLEWGRWDALFIDRRQIWTGPPPSYDKLERAIGKRVARLRG